MNFDELIKSGDDVSALKNFADEYYQAGQIGGTRSALLYRIADKLTPLPPKSADGCIIAPSDYVCPNCHKFIERVVFNDNNCTQIGETGEWTEGIELELKYCPECGQALDWSDC